MRYFIEISYNGKNFHGWQQQPNAITVQEEIEKALSLLIGFEVSVVGCGRTDAGVHASQFFAHFDLKDGIDELKFVFRLNAILPDSIVVLTLFKVNEKDHARFDAIYRSYEYRMFLGKNPFLTDTTWQIQNRNYNIVKMNQAAKEMLNYTNFKAFSRSKTDVKTYDCSIKQAEWIKDGKNLVFYITANRFLRNMVRAIVGTLLDVGLGKISIDDFKTIIENQDRTLAGASVKAHGLFLTKVGYPERIYENNNE